MLHLMTYSEFVLDLHHICSVLRKQPWFILITLIDKRAEMSSCSWVFSPAATQILFLTEGVKLNSLQRALQPIKHTENSWKFRSGVRTLSKNINNKLKVSKLKVC